MKHKIKNLNKMNYDLPSSLEPLPLSSQTNLPLHSLSYSAPLSQNSLPTSPMFLHRPTRIFKIFQRLFNFNLLLPHPVDEYPSLYFTDENQSRFARESPVYRALLCPFECEHIKISVVVSIFYFIRSRLFFQVMAKIGS